VLLAAPPENLASDGVRNNGAGLVVDPTDQAGFLQAALRLLDDDKLRADASAKARSFALNNYDIKKVTDRFETVFDYAIGAKTAERKI
jgi:colanic acid biosynthesis glycosyl transferase WcaI